MFFTTLLVYFLAAANYPVLNYRKLRNLRIPIATQSQTRTLWPVDLAYLFGRERNEFLLNVLLTVGNQLSYF